MAFLVSQSQHCCVSAIERSSGPHVKKKTTDVGLQVFQAPCSAGVHLTGRRLGAGLGTAELLKGFNQAMTQRTLLLSAAAVAVLALAACDKAQQQAPATGAPIAALPLAQAAPPPEQVAPYVNQLPPAPPLPRARPRKAAYSYIDDAYWMGDTFADSPPDYTVDYDGEYPWIWRTSDGAYRVVEDTPDGYREYYYYGDSDYPFLVRDAGYAYAYDGPQLVFVYDSYGRPYENYSPTLVDYATRDFYRGQRLYGAAIHQQRRAAYAADWGAHRDQILAQQQQWAAAQESNAAWRQVHEQRISREDPRFSAWNQERSQRVAYAARMAPVIAAAAAPAGPSRGPRPAFAGQVPAQEQARIQAQQQAAMAAQARQQQLQAQGANRQAFEQNRMAEQAAREQQRAQAQAQTRALAEQRRDAGLAAQQQHRAEIAQSERQRQQQRAQAEAQSRQLADQRRQAGLAAQQQHRAELAQAQQARETRGDLQRAEQAQAHARDVAARQQAQQAQQARMQERAQREQQVQAQQAQRAERQQAQAERAAHEQQAQARAAEQQQRQAQMAAQHEQQAQARAAEQQQRQAQQAQAAQQHAQQAAAVAAQHQGGGHPHPEKPDKQKP
jgi:hypothetical protein